MSSRPEAREAFGALFPGQLSEKVGMGERLASAEPEAAGLFEEISRRSGLDLPGTFFGSGSLNLHDNLPAQVGVYAVSLAAFDALARRGLVPSGVAGYSLGTYAAFVAAGVLDRWQALDVLLEVARLLQESPVEGAMGFVIGLSRDAVQAVMGGVSPDPEVLAIGNENAAQQFVLTGEPWAVLEALERARPTALRAELLPMTWPMHSLRLAPVSERVAAFISTRVRFRAPGKVALYAPMLGRRVRDVSEAAAVVAEQFSRPALWSGTLRAMGESGLAQFAEVGPSDVLTKLLRWTLREARGAVAEDPASIDALETFLERRPDIGARPAGRTLSATRAAHAREES